MLQGDSQQEVNKEIASRNGRSLVGACPIRQALCLQRLSVLVIAAAKYGQSALGFDPANADLVVASFIYSVMPKSYPKMKLKNLGER